MGEILGLGLTHSPSFIKPDEAKDSSLHRTLKNNPNVPAEMKNPSNWPEPMRIEFGEDEGLAAAKRMRERMVVGFRTLRAELDAFNPDYVIVWGDDQYENFKEDIIPPFCVLAYDEITCKPFTNHDGSAKENVWNEPADKLFQYPGHPQAARALVSGLINQGIDMAYAYKPLHQEGLGHADVGITLDIYSHVTPSWQTAFLVQFEQGLINARQSEFSQA